jgi:hypothetical protein
MVAAVAFAVIRYAGRDTASSLDLKKHLKDVHTAAKKLEKALQPRQYSNDLWPAIEEAYCTNPNGVQTEADAQNAMSLAGKWRDRIGHQQDFMANVTLIRDESKEALDRRKRPGRPHVDKQTLVEELTVIWRAGIAENPGYFGGASWDDPRTDFGQFIKISVQMLPCTDEFKTGFADMIRRASRAVKGGKPAPKN